MKAVKSWFSKVTALAAFAFAACFGLTAQAGVAKIGDTEYATLQAALDAVAADPENKTLSWVDESVWAAKNEAIYGDTQYETLTAAITAANSAGSSDAAQIFIRPNQANVTAATHARLTTSIVIYGNNARLASGWAPTIEYPGSSDDNGGHTLTKNVSHAIYSLHDGAGFWGSRTSNCTITLLMENCQNANESYVRWSSGIGQTVMTVKNCTFKNSGSDGNGLKIEGGRAASWPVAVYGNGSITVDGCSFEGNVAAVVGCLDCENATLAVSISNSEFKNLTGQDSVKGGIRIASENEGNISLSMSGCSFTGDHANPADITLGDKQTPDKAKATMSYSIVNTACSLMVTEKNSSTLKVNANIEASATPTTGGNATPVATTVAKVGTTEYSDLHEALEAAKTAGKTCELLSDVTLTGNWTPIADFAGTFDGKGYTISGLNLVEPDPLYKDGDGVAIEARLGLFANINRGIVKNLTIAGAKVTSTTSGARNIGILAGSAYCGPSHEGWVSNVTVSAATITSAGKYVGGLVGYDYIRIYDSKVVNSTIVGKDLVGGLAGYMWCGCIDGCTVTNNKIEATTDRAGGLIGRGQFSANNDKFMWVNDNVVSGEVTCPGIAGGLMGLILCYDQDYDSDTYEIKNNYINVTIKGGATQTNPIAVLSDNQREKFCASLSKNITGNWWEDATLNADCYTYENVASGVAPQTIYRGVAKIGDKCYKTLAAAIAAVGEIEGKTATITMIADELMDRNQGVTVPSGYTITLDLNGKTITVNVKVNAHSWAIQNWGNLTIKDSATGGTITNTKDEGVTAGDWEDYNYVSDIIDNDGTLTIESGVVENTFNGNICYAVDNNGANGSTPVFYMKGGTLKHATSTVVRLAPGSTGVSATISGGTIEGACGIVLNANNKDAPIITLNVTDGTIKAKDCALYESSAGLPKVDNPDTSKVNVSISGGVWGDGVVTSGEKLIDVSVLASKFITGGTYTEDVTTHCVDGYEVKANGTDPETWTVVEAARTIEVTPETVQEALDTAKKGDTIVLTAGDYGKLYLRNNGTTANRIMENVTITVKAGDAVTVDEFYQTAVSGKTLDIENLTIDGITFDDPTLPAVNFDVAGELSTGGNLRVNGLTIKNCTKVGNNSSTYASGESAYQVPYFAGFHYDADPDKCSGMPVTFIGDSSLECGYHNIQIVSNSITRVFQPIAFPNSGLLDGLTVVSNVFTECTDNHIQKSGSNTKGDYVITDNTIIGMTGRFARISGATSDMSVTVTNNTVIVPLKYDTGNDGSIFKVTGAAGFTVKEEDNEWTAGSFNDAKTTWVSNGDASLLVIAKVTVGQTVTYYTSLADALTAAKGSGAVCELLSDVTLTGNWTPISGFAGTFDGKGYTISGLTVTGTSNLGLFASTSGATIKDLTIDGATIGTTAGTTGTNVGVLVGDAGTSTITGVTVKNATIASNAQYVGGIAGTSSSTITGCQVLGTADAATTITGKDQVGGISGYQWCNGINNCTVSYCAVTALEERAGCLAGKLQCSSGNDSYFSMNGNTISNSSATAPDYAGGIAGQIMGDMANYEIKNNTIDATLTAPATNPIGTLRADQNAAFTGALAANITGNDWTDATLAANSFQYTNVASGVNPQTINRKTVVNYVAQIGAAQYTSLADAIAAVPTDGTVTTIQMIANETMDRNQGVTVPSTAVIILDLNGKTITGNAKESKVSWVIQNWGILTITDSATGGKITNTKDDVVQPGNPPDGPNYCSNVIDNDGTLTVIGGVIENTLVGSACYAVDNNGANSSTPVFYMTGGTLRNTNYTPLRFAPGSTVVTGKITGGTVEGAYGIVINANSQTAPKVALTVSGGTIKANCYAIYESSASSVTDTNNVSISISGGIWGNGTPEDDLIYITKLGSKFISGGTFSADPTAWLADGYAATKTGDAEWTVGLLIDPGSGEKTLPAVEQASEVSVNTVKVDSIVTNEVVASKVKKETTVAGVKLTTTETTTQKSGMQAVVDLAKAQNAELKTAIESDDASMVTVKVDVVVSPTKYVAGESGENAIAFDLTPYATVTVVNTNGTTTTSKSQIVDVNNSMIDTNQNIIVSIYTGFKPSLIIHKDDNGKLIDSYGTDDFVYVNGTCTLTIHHFSVLEAIDDAEAEAMIGTTLYSSLQAAFGAVKTNETISVLKDIALTASAELASGKKGVTLDLGGYTISWASTATDKTAGLIANSGELTLKGGTLNAGTTVFATCTGNGETTPLYITDGYYTGTFPSASTATNAGPIFVSGGYFQTVVPAAFCAVGYVPDENPKSAHENMYTVKDANVYIRNISAKQRYPWNGYVDITFEMCMNKADEVRLFVAAYDSDGARITGFENVTWLSDDGEKSVNVKDGSFKVAAQTKKTIHLLWNSAVTYPNQKVEGITFKVYAK